MTYSKRSPGKDVQLRPLLYVHVGINGSGWVVLVGGGHIEALREVVLTVGPLAGLHQNGHRRSHVYLDA